MSYQGGDNSVPYTASSQYQPTEPIYQPQPGQAEAAPAPGGFGAASGLLAKLPEPVRDGKLVLRSVEAFLALLTFSCAAGGVQFIVKAQGFQTFLVFVGVMAMLIDLAFILVYLRGHSLPESLRGKLPLVEFIISVLWTVLWFAGSTAFAVGINSVPPMNAIVLTSTANAAAVFGFFSFFLWAGSSFLAFRRWRSGATLSGGPVQYADL